MAPFNQPDAEQESEQVCDRTGELDCETSPLQRYRWMIVRIGRYLKQVGRRIHTQVMTDDRD